MAKFTASNGVVIVSHPGGSVHWEAGTLPTRVGAALREFFRHERDEELGRWRWPENPDCVVYPTGVTGETGSDYQECVVIDEATGTALGFGSDLPNCHGGHHREAARAYFAAHPVSKPLPSEPRTAWVDKYGTDIWVVTAAGTLRCVDSPSSDPAKYAPFTQLVKEQSND